jgi:hypothetical protein
MSDLRPDAVVVATLAATDTPIHFTTCWGNMLQYDAARGQHLMNGGGNIAITSGPRIAEARSQIVDAFFADERLQASWLLMIDSDMTFPPDLVERLLEVADPTERPIVGGLCFAGGRDHDPYPTIYREVETKLPDGKSFVGIEPIHDYPEDQLVRVGGTGAACMLVHRQVFIAMSHPYPKGFGTTADGTKTPYPWFVEGLVTPTGEPIGEDIAFCRRATQLGIPIHVDTSIKLGHVKQFVLDEQWYRGTRMAREAAQQQVVDEAAERTAMAQGERKSPAERRAAARAAIARNGSEPEDRSDEILAGALAR